jgi:hypothetical protein
MAKTQLLMARPDRIPSPLPAAGKQWRWPVHREVEWTTLAFRVGGIVLGTVGCILGAWMPYGHPVARTLSVLWWGVFLGCLGGSLAVVACLLAERAPACPIEGSAVPTRLRTGAAMTWPAGSFEPPPHGVDPVRQRVAR